MPTSAMRLSPAHAASSPTRPNKRSFFNSSFKDTHPKVLRMAEARKIKLKFPDRVPVIVERADGIGCGNAPDIDKNKFLIPANLTVGQLVLVIRRRIGMSATDALFVFVSVSRTTNKPSSRRKQEAAAAEEHTLTLPPTSISIAEVFEQSKDEDGFLYVKYAGENVFGAKGGSSSSSSSSTAEGRRRPSRSSGFSPALHSLPVTPPASSSCFPPAPSEFAAFSKPGVARRLQAAVASRRAKKRAAKEAKLLESSAAAHTASVGRGGGGAAVLGSAAVVHVPIKSRYRLSVGEREELKRLRQPMLGKGGSTTASASTTHNPAFRNYGTMPELHLN